MSLTDELRELHQLHQDGAIDDDELARAKAKLLGGSDGALASEPMTEDQQTRQWALALHLSQFAGYAIPFAGLIVPILIWQIKKTELPGLDAHGKVVANWIVSEILYCIVFFALSFVVIGIPLLFVVAVLGLVFPIVGAIKASNGEVWRYPGSLPVFD